MKTCKVACFCFTKLKALPSDPDRKKRGCSFSLLNISSENVKAQYVLILNRFADLNLESSFFAFTEPQFILGISKYFTENGYTLF